MLRYEETIKFQSVARTHAGDVRERNEDRFLERADVGLWAVADGMGGHRHGEVASGLLVDGLAEIQGFATPRAALDAVLASIQGVNQELMRRARLVPGHVVIGSTVVVLIAHGEHFACLWAGDSRAYLLRDRQLKQLTNDHSVVQRLIDHGQLARTDARSHHRSNVITRAVGITQNVELDGCHSTLKLGDTFLLCSDGLSNMIDDDEICGHLANDSLETAADNLLAQSLQRGARDDVTIVLVRATAKK